MIATPFDREGCDSSRAYVIFAEVSCGMPAYGLPESGCELAPAPRGLLAKGRPAFVDFTR